MKNIVLLIEDDLDLLNNNREYLSMHGYGALIAETLGDAEKILDRYLADLILMDVNLPDGSGFDFILKLRETSSVPVIFLTGRSDKTDVLEGFARGSCDYITKPFDLDLMLARVKAHLELAEQKSAARILRTGPLSLDYIALKAFLKGREMNLSPKEFSILLMLAQSENTVINAGALYEKIWGHPMLGDDIAVRSAVSRLRKKLVGSGYTIAVSRGMGYSFERV